MHVYMINKCKISNELGIDYMNDLESPSNISKYHFIVCLVFSKAVIKLLCFVIKCIYTEKYCVLRNFPCTYKNAIFMFQ